jgi:hypothetical protein
MGTMSDPEEERVLLALKRLQLAYLREMLAAVLAEAAREQWTYLERARECSRAGQKLGAQVNCVE